MMTQPSRDKNLGKVLQANRVPIALIGVGIGWLFASNTGLAERVAADERVRTARRRIGEIGIVRAGGEGTDGWVHQAAGAARGAVGSVRETGSAVLDRAGSITSYAGDAGDLAKRADGQLAEKLERDPWLIGVVGFVAGALLAAVAPLTRTEQELARGAREELHNKATELGHEAAERVRELAETTTRPSRQ